MPRSHGNNTSLLRAFAAGPHAIVSPVLAFSARRNGNRPFVVLLVIVCLTALAASLSNPVTARILQTTPGIAASASLARTFVLVQSAILTPVGTAVFLVVMATTLWAIALVAGKDLTFRQSASIVFMAGIVVALKRLFAAGVLYARLWFQPSSLTDKITTGLDGFIDSNNTTSIPISILREGGLFEIWFLILIAIGLQYTAQLSRRSAVSITLAVGVILIGSRVAIAALTRV